MTRRTAAYAWLALATLTLWRAEGVCVGAETRDLLLAARSGQLDEVKRLVEGGMAVDASDDRGTTPLYLAARHGRIAVARYLLDQGADPSSRESFFDTSGRWNL